MNDLSVLVVSFDAYSDLWDTFFKLFKRYWGDCPYKLYLGANNKKYEGVDTIDIGDDVSWCDNLRKYLEAIESPYVLTMLEDYFLDKKVDNESVKALFDYVRSEDLDCLRLRPAPIADHTVNKKLNVGVALPGAPYYINAQPAIWKKESLLKLLKPGYNAWQFEIENSRASAGLDYKVYTSNVQVLSFHNGVERGKYYASTVEFLNREGLTADFETRGIIDDTGCCRRLKEKASRAKLHLCIKLRLYKTRFRNLILKNI